MARPFQNPYSMRVPGSIYMKVIGAPDFYKKTDNDDAAKSASLPGTAVRADAGGRRPKVDKPPKKPEIPKPFEGMIGRGDEYPIQLVD